MVLESVNVRDCTIHLDGGELRRGDSAIERARQRGEEVREAASNNEVSDASLFLPTSKVTRS